MNTTTPPIPGSQVPPTLPPPVPQPRRKAYLRTVVKGIFLVVLLTAGCLLSGVLFQRISNGTTSFANREKIQLMTRVQSLHFPQNADMAKASCTPKGYQIWTGLRGSLPGPKSGFQITGFNNSGDICDVAMVSNTVEGRSLLHIRLIREREKWCFDDIYYNSMNGREINLWCSVIRESPFLAAIKIGMPELKQGYQEAKEAVKGAADMIHDISTIIKLLKEQEPPRKVPASGGFPRSF